MEKRFSDEFWMKIQDQISEVAIQYDQIWRKRIRLIGSELLFLFIFKLVLSKNKQGYGSLLIELWDNSSDKNLKLPKEDAVAASSICDAMQKLPEEAFVTLNKRIIEEWEKEFCCVELWYGHRLFAVDGSKLNLPRELIEVGYKTPGDHSYYPQGLVSCLYDLKKAVAYDFDLVSHMNERDCAMKHFKVLKPGDVVVFDRGYFSYLMVKEAFDRGIFAVFRLPRNFSNDQIKEFWESDETDKIVSVQPPKDLIAKSKNTHSGIEYDAVNIRLIKYVISDETYVLATLLIDECYPASIFPDLYHSRWGIEELYKVSKCHIDVEDFHGKSERRVKQELYAQFVLVCLARIFECQAEQLLPQNLTGTFINESHTQNTLEAEIVSPKEGQYLSQPETKKLSSQNQVEMSGCKLQNKDDNTAKAMIPEKNQSPIAPGTAITSEDKEKEKNDSTNTRVKLNFKNCLLVLQRTLECLFLLNPMDFINEKVSRVLKGIVRLRQKVRPDRHYPRISRKPLKRRKHIPQQDLQLPAAIAAPG